MHSPELDEAMNLIKEELLRDMFRLLSDTIDDTKDSTTHQ